MWQLQRWPHRNWRQSNSLTSIVDAVTRRAPTRPTGTTSNPLCKRLRTSFMSWDCLRQGNSSSATTSRISIRTCLEIARITVCNKNLQIRLRCQEATSSGNPSWLQRIAKSLSTGSSWSRWSSVCFRRPSSPQWTWSTAFYSVKKSMRSPIFNWLA